MNLALTPGSEVSFLLQQGNTEAELARASAGSSSSSEGACCSTLLYEHRCVPQRARGTSNPTPSQAAACAFPEVPTDIWGVGQEQPELRSPGRQQRRLLVASSLSKQE